MTTPAVYLSTDLTHTAPSRTEVRVRPRTAPVLPMVGALSGLALIPMVVGHISGAGILDPFVDPISYYAFVPGGYLAVAVGAVLLALCGGVLAHRLTGVPTAQARVAAVMMLSFSAAMLLVGFFPTDRPGLAHASLSATLHRLGAAWAFVILPVLGLTAMRSIACGTAGRVLTVMSVGTGVAVAIFFSIHVPLALHGGHIPAFGLIERLGFMLMVAYLIAVAVTLRTRR